MGRNKTRQQNTKHMKNNKLNPKQSTFASIEYTDQKGNVSKKQVILGISYANACKRSIDEINNLGTEDKFSATATLNVVKAIKSAAASGHLAKPETVALNDETDLLMQACEMTEKAIKDQYQKLTNPQEPKQQSSTGKVLFPCQILKSETLTEGAPVKKSVSAAQSIANRVVRGMLPHTKWRTLDQAAVTKLNGEPFTA